MLFIILCMLVHTVSCRQSIVILSSYAAALSVLY